MVVSYMLRVFTEGDAYLLLKNRDVLKTISSDKFIPPSIISEDTGLPLEEVEQRLRSLERFYGSVLIKTYDQEGGTFVYRRGARLTDILTRTPEEIIDLLNRGDWG